MAYETSQTQAVILASGGTHEHSATGTGAKGTWGPGFHPHIIRSCSVQVLVTDALSSTNGVVSFRKVDPAGSASATGDEFATVTLASGAQQGKITYKAGLDTEIKPGEEVEANVVTGAGAGVDAVRLTLMIEPRWEVPGNNSDLVTG